MAVRSEILLGDASERGPSRYSLREVLTAVRRNLWLVMICGTLGLAASVVAIWVIEPVFTAESAIVLDARRPRVVDLPSLVAEQTTNPEAPQLRSEVEILQGEDLAIRVVNQLGLVNREEFQHHNSLLRQLVNDGVEAVTERFPILGTWYEALRPAWAPAVEAEALADSDMLGAAVEAYRKRLQVINDGRSYVIRVRFSSADPKLAAAVVNAHVQLYLGDQIAFKQQVGKQAAEWLGRELTKLEQKLRTSQEAVQNFREENHIVQTGNGTTMLSQQLATINAQLPVAEADLSASLSRLQNARDLLRRKRLDTESQVLQSPAIQRLRDQEATLLARQAELSTVYGDKHPAVAKVDAELGDVRAALRSETDRIISSFSNEVQVADSRVARLRTRLAELERQTVEADRAVAKLHDLEREVGANGSLIEVLLTRYKQVSAQEGIQQADARVVSAGTVPSQPSFPKASRVVPGSIAIGVLVGMVLALLRELMRPGFKGSQEVELECELPSLGFVPMVPRLWPGAPRLEDLVVERPRSGFAEAIRYVRNSVQTTAGSTGEQASTLLVTSSLPNEGKTVVAASLARSYAQAGRQTLLIDCDLRRPSVGAAMNGREGPGAPARGVSTILAGEDYWRDVVQRDTKSSLDYIPAGPVSAAPQDLLGGNGLRQLLADCRTEYDVIVIDSPPITAVSDPLIISRHVYATILVVRWGTTPREIAKTSLSKLFASGARLCGVVLTAVDMRRGVFSPADIEYYHERNRKYYVG